MQLRDKDKKYITKLAVIIRKKAVPGMLRRDEWINNNVLQINRYRRSLSKSDESNFYGGLIDYKAKEHYRAKHSKNKFANGKNRVNDIKNF